MIINSYRVRQSTELAVIFKENDAIFGNNRKLTEIQVLMIFLLFELEKGAKSEWKPYLDMLPDDPFFKDWSTEAQEAVQHPQL